MSEITEKVEDPQRYRTPREQIDLLISRNLKFKNEKSAERTLEKINYYNLLNPYGKLFFKEKDLYLDKAYFEDIYSFYKFDKKLAGLFLIYILHIESSLKTAISHVVSAKGDEGHKEESYLDISIFENASLNKSNKEREDNQKFLKELKETITNSNKKYIKHNRKEYNNVPFWVLCNEMYFSETIYYYEKLLEKDRNKVSLLMRGENKDVRLNLRQFRSAIYMARDLRNLIAHDEVIYWFRPLNYKGQPRFYGFSNYKNIKPQEGSIATIMLVLNMYLDSDNWNDFYFDFEKLLKKLYKQIPEDIFNTILNEMGFYKILNKDYKNSTISINDIFKLYN